MKTAIPQLNPRPFQLIGAQWLTEKKLRLLADEMGIGKSAQCIVAADLLAIPRILIVCPAIARLTWLLEFPKFSVFSRKIRILESRSETPNDTDEVIICSFDYATASKEKLLAWKKDVLIVDESHFLKSIDAKRTRAVLARSGLIHSSPRSWFLSGTPMPNHPAELWPILYSFGATKLNYWQFVEYFCETYDFNGAKVISGAKTHRLSELFALLKPHMLRRMKSEVLKELPPIVISDLYVEASLRELPPNLLKIHHDILKRLEFLSDDPLAQLSALELVSESVSTIRRFCAHKKVDTLAALVDEELKNNAYPKIVIFGVHIETIEKLKEALSAHNPVVVRGGISGEERQRSIDRFQTDPTCRVFIGNIQAAGTNITLTAADQVLFVEQEWVPGHNAQAIARCHRIGQKSTCVSVRVASIKDSIDETVNRILFRKALDIQKLFSETA